MKSDICKAIRLIETEIRYINEGLIMTKEDAEALQEAIDLITSSDSAEA